VKIYFSGDEWQEFGSGGFTQTRSRKVFATFTYRNGESCLYGTAEVVQKFDVAESKFGELRYRSRRTCLRTART
jgi:hypothetical protein